jgi:hypothetical protein
VTALASVRDASWLAHPRHDGPSGHRPGAWSPKHHVVIDHPARGASWSACGRAFLLSGGDPAHEIPDHARCRLNGCRQAFERADAAQRNAPSPSHPPIQGDQQMAVTDHLTLRGLCDGAETLEDVAGRLREQADRIEGLPSLGWQLCQPVIDDDLDLEATRANAVPMREASHR